MLNVQLLQHGQVAEPRWDGASELIILEVPEKATVNKCEYSAQ